MDNNQLEEKLAGLEKRNTDLEGRYLKEALWTNELGRRLDELEKKHESLEGRYLTCMRNDGRRIYELELKIKGLESRIKDLDQLENIALASYQKTHPKAQAKVEEIKEAIEDARSRLWFESSPTYQEHLRDKKT
jgi:hypothetical protein